MEVLVGYIGWLGSGAMNNRTDRTAFAVGPGIGLARPEPRLLFAVANLLQSHDVRASLRYFGGRLCAWQTIPIGFYVCNAQHRRQ